MVGAGTCFEADLAGRKAAEKGLDIVTPEAAAQHNAAFAVGRMNLEHELRDIEPDAGDFVRHGALPLWSAPPTSVARTATLGEWGHPCHHSRRKFFDLAKGGSAPAAERVLALIAELYRIEQEIRGQPPDRRRDERRERSRPVLDELHRFLCEHLRKVPGSSVIAEAIRYVLTRWDGLVLFVDDGHIELDTNPVERAMRPIALNRKNALFAGSDDGAEHWAILATLIECCKLNDVNPVSYLEDVITRLVAGHLNSRIDELTPWNWKAERAAAQG